MPVVLQVHQRQAIFNYNWNIFPFLLLTHLSKLNMGIWFVQTFFAISSSRQTFNVALGMGI